jgi:hypothetical protein
MRLILSSLVVLAWISGPIHAPKLLPPTAKPAAHAAVPSVDFHYLHNQAREALEALRQTQANHRRMTVASAN